MPCATLCLVFTFGYVITRASNCSGCYHALCHFTHDSHLWLCNTQGIEQFRVFSCPVPLYTWFSPLAVQYPGHQTVQGVLMPCATLHMVLTFGCAIPRASKSSGCLTGSSMTSLISLICLSRPPTISYVESGTFSTIIKLTSGSTWHQGARQNESKHQHVLLWVTYTRKDLGTVKTIIY